MIVKKSIYVVKNLGHIYQLFKLSIYLYFILEGALNTSPHNKSSKLDILTSNQTMHQSNF